MTLGKFGDLRCNTAIVLVLYPQRTCRWRSKPVEGWGETRRPSKLECPVQVDPMTNSVNGLRTPCSVRLAYAVSLVRNRAEAEDLVHDCYRRLLARADQYNLPVDGTKLLFKSITNACINWSRRRPPMVSLDAAERGIGADRRAFADRADVGARSKSHDRGAGSRDR